MMLASGVTMFVASSRPPSPVSQITRSHFLLRKIAQRHHRHDLEKCRVRVRRELFQQLRHFAHQPHYVAVADEPAIDLDTLAEQH